MLVRAFVADHHSKLRSQLLAELFATHPSLRTVNLTSNDITDAGAAVSRTLTVSCHCLSLHSLVILNFVCK